MARILTRIVRATEQGWEYKCDQRHVEIILEQLELQSLKSLNTPSVEDSTTPVRDGDELPITGDLASLLRAIMARAIGIRMYRTALLCYLEIMIWMC